MSARLLAVALIVALSPTASAAPHGSPPPSSPLFPGIAYAEVPGTSGFELVEIEFGSGTRSLSAVSQYFVSAGFANDDFTVEYAIDYPEQGLYSIDTADGTTTRIGSLDIEASGLAYGPRWDAQTGTAYVMVSDASCESSTLYTIDLTSAAMTPVGGSDSCITAFAIDPVTNIFYGIDVVSAVVVAIDSSTGAATEIEPVDVLFTRVDDIAFDPANDALYVTLEQAGAEVPNLYVYVPGAGMGLVGPADGTALAFAKRDGFFNGFEKPGF